MENYMCNVHNKMNGSEAVVELEYINRNLKKVCSARHYYLEKQVESFRTWLDARTDDVDASITNIIYWHFDHDSEVSDMQVDTTSTNPTTSERMDIEVELQQEMNMLMEKNVSRSIYSKDSTKAFYQYRIDAMTKEQGLHNQIQDFLDTLKPTTVLGQYKAVFKKLDLYKKQGKLGYDGWLIFSNQLLVLIGRKPMSVPADLKLLPDRIAFYEGKLKEVQAEQDAKALEFFETPLDSLDNQMITVSNS